MKLTVVIIEYHSIEDVKSAIASTVEHLGDVDGQVLVISNSLYDVNKQDHVRKEWVGASVIFNEVNGGYAGGVNKALQMIDSDYMFLLNPDATLENTGMNELITEMESNNKLAIIGPRVVDSNGRVQPSCRGYPKPYTFLMTRSFMSKYSFSKNERSRYLIDGFERNVKRNVDWVSGGAMLVRISSVEKVGGMDERYFLYMEDVDWCKTFKTSGFEIQFNPALEVCHAGQHSSIRNGVFAIFNKTTRWHLISLYRYFNKWGWF